MQQIGIQHKMIIYGEIERVLMKLEYDPAYLDIIYQLKQNGDEFI
jgi:hypothetical protein